MVPVASLIESLGEDLKGFSTSAARYGLIGSAFLYLFGYLALRFHLTAIGLGSDLPVFDERYLFTGAEFLVYVAACVPRVLLYLLPIIFIGWLISRAIPQSARAAIIERLTMPAVLIPFGIVFSVLVIERIMSPCFNFRDLLLGRQLPSDPPWYVTLMYQSWTLEHYFGGLVAFCVIPIGILVILRNNPDVPKFGYGLLAFLAAVQVMLLPINYGVLVVDKSLPRVAALGDRPLASGQTAWLVWQDRGGVTYLVRDAGQDQDSAQDRRSLVTFYNSREVSKEPGKEEAAQTYTTEKPPIQIVGYDEIIPTLYGNRYVRGSYYMWRLRQQGLLPPRASPRSVPPHATPPAGSTEGRESPENR